MIATTIVVRKDTMHETIGIRRKVKEIQKPQEVSKAPVIKGTTVKMSRRLK